MKILLAVFAFASGAQAADVRLAWNPSLTPGIDRYVVHAAGPLGVVNVDVGTNCTASIPTTSGRWRFSVSCWLGDFESDWAPWIEWRHPFNAKRIRGLNLR